MHAPSSPAAARPGRVERTNPVGNLPAARPLFLLARHLEEGRTINFCFSDRGWLFPLTRYRPPRDARDTLGCLQVLSKLLEHMIADAQTVEDLATWPS